MIRVRAELYDSRAWLDRTGSAIGPNEVNALELVQAYIGADFDDVLGNGSKLGLQVQEWWRRPLVRLPKMRTAG